MNRGLLILLAGLTAGVSGHFGYFAWQRPNTGADQAQPLAWMKQELNLDEAQYSRIVALHEQSGSHLKDLSSKVDALRAQYAGFEAKRLGSDEVDFLAFARYVESRKDLDQDCNESARNLVAETAGVLTPAQRGRYLQLLAAGGGQWLMGK